MKPMFERLHYDAMAALIQKIPDPQARILTGLHPIRELESQPNFKPFRFASAAGCLNGLRMEKMGFDPDIRRRTKSDKWAW